MNVTTARIEYLGQISAKLGLLIMWRSFFLAVGLTLCILGLECMFVQKAVLATSPNALNSSTQDFQNPYAADYGVPVSTETGVIEPPEWAAWVCLSLGVIVIMYSHTLRWGGQGE